MTTTKRRPLTKKVIRGLRVFARQLELQDPETGRTRYQQLDEELENMPRSNPARSRLRRELDELAVAKLWIESLPVTDDDGGAS